MRRPHTTCLILAIAMLAGGTARAAVAAQLPDEVERWWLEGGIGAAQVDAGTAGFSGRRGSVVLSGGGGYRVLPNFGIGLEYASNAPLSGCQQWDCAGNQRDFKPGFNRISLFGELRLFEGAWRMRYGAGDGFYCYRGTFLLNFWYLLIDNAQTRHSSCSSVSELAQLASLGYYWRADPATTAGLRLGVEAADFHARPAVGLPSLRYRAVTLTLQLSVN